MDWIRWWIRVGGQACGTDEPVLTVPVMPLQRTMEIRRRRMRRKRLAKLRAKLQGARNEQARAKVLAKAFRVSPTAVLE